MRRFLFALLLIAAVSAITSCGGGGGASTPPPTPEVSVAPTNLAFGNQPYDTTSAAQTVTLSNTGNASLSITSIAVTGANASDFAQTNTCGSSVAAGANCAIAVMFTPSALGTWTAALSISDNASGSPQSVALSGTGAHYVALSWTASSTSGVVGYNAYRGTASSGPFSQLNSSSISATTYTDGNVQAG
jgi:predicted small lipoprotein YifL